MLAAFQIDYFFSFQNVRFWIAVTGMASNISVKYIYIIYLSEAILFLKLLFGIGYIQAHTRTHSGGVIHEVPHVQTSNHPVIALFLPTHVLVKIKLLLKDKMHGEYNVKFSNHPVYTS
jgi:hypothetical protein